MSAPDVGVVAAAARATGRPAHCGVILRRSRSTLVRFGDVLARVRRCEDRLVAQRETAVSQVLEGAGVPAVRAVDVVGGGEGRTVEIDGLVITVWQWIDGVGRLALPAEVGRLAARLHGATMSDGETVRSSEPSFDPLGATRNLLLGDRGTDALLLGSMVEELSAPWAEARASDPLGAALVHGDLHVENVLVSAEGPMLVDLELAGTGPPSYDAAPMAIAVDRYGADPSSLDAFLQSWPDDPRRWPGFDVCRRVYEAWVTAWAVSQRAASPDAAEESAIRMAALRGGPSREWTVR